MSNRIMFGKQLYGKTLFGGIISSAVISNAYEFPILPNGWKIAVHDENYQKVWETGWDVAKTFVKSFTFDLEEYGCGAFNLEFLSKPPVELKEQYSVVIYLFGDGQPWYTGQIENLPPPGTTAETYIVKGFGYFTLLDHIIVNKSYSARSVATMVRDIITTVVEPQSAIEYSSGLISAGYYIADQWDVSYQTAKKALQDLADLEQSVQMGVDEQRRFYFKPVVDTVNDEAIFWVGKHVNSFTPEKTFNSLANRIHIKSGKLQADKTNISGMVEDAASQGKYGLREVVLTIPSALNEADATRWAQYQLDLKKEPIIKAKLSGIEVKPGTRIQAEGNARVNCLDGTIYEFPIKKVRYTVADSIKVDLELGEKYQPLGKEFVDLLKALKNAEALSAANFSQI